MSIDTKELTRFAKSVRHPLRIMIIQHLLVVGEGSPKDLSTYFRKSLGVVAYHVDELRKLGVLRLKRQEPRRGASEHFYVLTPYAQTVLNVVDFIAEPWPDTRD